MPQAARLAAALVWVLLLTSGPAGAAGGTVSRPAHRFTGRAPGKPAYLWLWYADGKAMPEFSQYCGDYTPPAYQCNFGSSLDDCKEQVQTYLDAWYKDFNLVFTFTRPPSSDYYTVVITSGWPQCATEAADLTGGIAADEGGIAPGNSCNDNPGNTAIAIACGKNAHDCATIIAHEHGHLVGLEHTDSILDVMNPRVRSTAAGFDNADDGIVAAANAAPCGGLTQNSYKEMLDTLGPWPGGPKPSVSLFLPDAGAPDVTPTDASDATLSVGSIGYPPTGPRTDATVVVLPGFDALTRPPLVLADGSLTGPTSNHSGCTFVPGSRANAGPTAVTVAFLAVIIVFFMGVGRRRELLGRRARCRDLAARRAQSRHFLA